MVDKVGQNPTSQGTLPSAASPVPTLQRSVATQAQSQIPGFGAAFSENALTPSFASETASKVIAATSVKLGELQGTAFAEKNPNVKHFFPAMTKSDEAFANAYSSRAQQILGDQINSLINTSRESAASAGKLTDGVVNSFQQSASKGINDILDNAPDSIRDEMKYRYHNQVNNDAHILRMQVIADTQKAQEEAQLSYNNSQVKNSYQTSFTDGIEKGMVGLDLFTKDLQRQKDAGTIDQKEFTTLRDSAQLNMYVGAASKGIYDARANEKAAVSERDPSVPTVAKYLENVHDSLPKSMSELEKMAVVKSTVEYTKQLHSAERQGQQLTLAGLNRALADKTIDGAMLSQAETELSPADYNNFMAKFWSTTSKRDAESEIVRNIANNFSTATVAVTGTTKEKNQAFNALVNKSLTDNPGQDPMVVKTGIAKTAGVEVPAFVQSLDAMITRGAPEEAYTAMRSYNEVHDFEPQNVKSLPKTAQAIAAMMNDLHQVAGLPLEDSWAQAKEAVLHQSKEQLEARELTYREYHASSLSSSGDIASTAKSLLNVPYFTDVPNLPSVSNGIMRLHKDYFMITGSVSAANTLTTKALEKSYGISRANGRRQKVFMPIESLAGIGTDYPDIVHADMQQNISSQLEATKTAYDAGNVDWYYRVSEKAPGKKEPVGIERVYRGTAKTQLPSQGLIEKGNINLFNRPQVKNSGNISTVLSMSIGTDKGEVLIPRVSDDGRILSERNAIQLYRDSGKNLGVFKSADDATSYAKALHTQQQELYSSQVVTPYSVQISASSNLQRTENPASPYAGYYDIALIDKNGFPAPISTVSTGPVHQFAYRPNLQRINSAYTLAKNQGMTPEQFEAKTIERFMSSYQAAEARHDRARQEEGDTRGRQ